MYILMYCCRITSSTLATLATLAVAKVEATVFLPTSKLDRKPGRTSALEDWTGAQESYSYLF